MKRLFQNTLRIVTFQILAISAYGQAGMQKGIAFYESGKYAEAKSVFEAVKESSGEYAMAQCYLGMISFDQGEYDDAVDFFEEATEANPREADYFNRLGNTYGQIAKDANVFTQASMAVKVRKAWEKVIELDPKHKEARVSLIGFYSQAPGFMGGSIPRAKTLAWEIVPLDPAEGHWQMGSILAREKNYADAEKEFAKMLQVDREYVKNLGGYYADQKQFDKAFDLLEEALRRNPDDYVTLYRYGKASAMSGKKLDRGEECLKKYLGHKPAYDEPSQAGAYMRSAQIKEKKGNKAEAKKYYEIALKQDDDLKEAKEGLVRTSK